MIRIGNVTTTDFPLLLAPMEDVSDPPFRAVCKENGADLMYTEFISFRWGLFDMPPRASPSWIFSNYERPIGIQIFGNNIDSMREAVEITEQA